MDAALISHGHPDHVGSLDWLDRLGNPPVYATARVGALSENPVLGRSYRSAAGGHDCRDSGADAALTDTPHRRLVNAEIVLWKPVDRQWNCHECFKPLG